MKWQVLGLVLNTLAADEKYPVLNWDDITTLFQMILSQKQNTFSGIFRAFLKSGLNLEHFEKEDDPESFLFPKLRTLKTLFDECLKSPVSEDPLKSNLVNGPKHCWNLYHRTFIIFIKHCEGN